MMKEIQDDEASPSTAKIAELDLLEDDGAEDVTSAILDSLIQGIFHLIPTRTQFIISTIISWR